MRKIAMWGAGKAGKYILSKTSDLYEIGLVIDNNAKNVAIQGVPVCSPQDCLKLMDEEFFGVLIGINNEMLIPDIVNQMAELGIQKAGVFKNQIQFDEPVDMGNIVWFDPTIKTFLPYLETNIIDQCNLKCKGCTHFSNLFTHVDKDEETIEDLEKDLSLIAKHVFVRTFRILGGEPFLSPNIVEYIEMARRFLPDADIRIVTNGTLIFKVPDSTYECISRNYVTIDITSYPPIQRKKDSIKEYLESKGVQYTFTSDVREFIRCLDIKGDNKPLVSHDICNMKACRFLRGGRLYTCPLEGMIYKYAKCYQIEDLERLLPYLGRDIHDEKFNWRWIYQLQNKPNILCRYCDENGGESYEWSVSTNPKKDDWLISLDT